MDNDGKKVILEQEKAKGEAHQRAYDNYVKPFFEAKEAELFEAFKYTPSTDTDALVMIRLQLNALEGLKTHFEHYIQTGRMAEATLTEMEKEDGN
jgi:hypothetical protein